MRFLIKMFAEDFQRQIVNGGDPSVSQMRLFEAVLKNQQAKLLIYNKQVMNPLTERMIRIARKYHVPIVGVTEIQPVNSDYISWMWAQLKDLDLALTHYKAK